MMQDSQGTRVGGPTRYVIVYGTLRAGGSNDITRLRPMPGFVARTLLRGSLYDFGGWPGLRLDGSGPVVGEVYRIDPALEPGLDRLEGVRDDDEGHYRQRSIAVPLGTQTLQCLVYEIHPARVAGRPLVAGGDWIAHRLRRSGE